MVKLPLAETFSASKTQNRKISKSKSYVLLKENLPFFIGLGAELLKTANE